MMRIFRPALLLVFALCASAAFAQPSMSSDGCDAQEGPVDQQLQKAANFIQTSDRGPAFQIVDAIVKTDGTHPGHLLSAGRLFERMGITLRAKEVFEQAKTKSEALSSESEAAKIYLAAAHFRLGMNEEGMRVLDSVRNVDGNYKNYACHFIDVAFAMYDKGQRSVAMNLMREVRNAVPSSRSIHDAFVSLAMESKKPEAIEAALGAARNQFPDDIEFAVRHANQMKVSGKKREARKLLESYLIKGESGQSLLGELLGLVSGSENARALLPQYKALATRYPDLPAIKMMVGVMHHYLGDFAESNVQLEQVGELVDKEPRVAMYMAMNYFRLGNEEQAQTFISKAADAGIPDPDVYYCRAVIFVRQDPVGSLRDLQRYMDMTRHRPDVNPSKQKRVQQTITMIRGCVEGSDPKQCVEQMVVEEARNLAFEEHFSKDAVAAREKAKVADAAPSKADTADKNAPALKPASGTETPASDDGGGPPFVLIGGALAVIVLLGLVLRARKSKES
jgi:Flp pilus assembly protein TadD